MKPVHIKMKAIADYQRGDRLAAIALRYGVSLGTVSLWAKIVGLARRDRGCRTKQLPSEIDMQVVEAVRAVKEGRPTLEEIGEAMGGYSRANVHRIYHKWKNWKPCAPFKAGQFIRILDDDMVPQDYVVLEPDVFNGRCRHIKTGVVCTITWVRWIKKADREKGLRAEAVAM